MIVSQELIYSKKHLNQHLLKRASRHLLLLLCYYFLWYLTSIILKIQTCSNSNIHILSTVSLHQPRDVSLHDCLRQGLLVSLQAGRLGLCRDLQEKLRHPRVSRERGALLQGDEEVTSRRSVFQDHEEVSGAASGSGWDVLQSHEEVSRVFRKRTNNPEALPGLGCRAASLVRARSEHKPSAIPLQSQLVNQKISGYVQRIQGLSTLDICIKCMTYKQSLWSDLVCVCVPL